MIERQPLRSGRRVCGLRVGYAAALERCARGCRLRGWALEAGAAMGAAAPSRIERLNAEVATLRKRLSRKNTELDALKKFQATALSRLTAQHDEITRLRREMESASHDKVRTLRSR
ncbi:hypothetical protein ACWEQ2_20350 [Streptomyces sp. NPDC004096]